jgi:NAD(P)-dependent dehydrogenase (short-subunit alcohol dehydrogenase family)
MPLVRAAKGNIVNVSSVAGRVPQPYTTAYSAAKGGLTMLTRALALELSPEGIRVNAICPGTVDTPMFRESMSPEVIENLLTAAPIGRLAEAGEIADIALWLCADAPGFLTGQAIAVDGGLGA